MSKWFIVLFALCCHLSPAQAADSSELPPCSELQSRPGQMAQYRIGLALPANKALVQHVASLGQFYDEVLACQEEWSSVLPAGYPWSKVAELEKYYGFGVYALGLVLTLLVFAGFTPRSWWRRPTALGLLALGLGTWLMASACLLVCNSLGITQKLFYGNVISLQIGYAQPVWHEVADVRALDRLLFQQGFKPEFSDARFRVTSPAGPLVLTDQPGGKPVSQAPAASAAPLTTGKSVTAADGQRYVEVKSGNVAAWARLSDIQLGMNGPVIGQTYRVRQSLALRDQPSVAGQRLHLLAPGSEIIALGEVQGDWWNVAQGQNKGWVNSLWLRQKAER